MITICFRYYIYDWYSYTSVEHLIVIRDFLKALFLFAESEDMILYKLRNRIKFFI